MKIGRTHRVRAAARRASRKFVVESSASGQLDTRVLPAVSAFVASGILNVVGDTAANTITIRRVGDMVSIDGRELSYNATSLTGVRVDGGAGNDKISLATAPGQVALGLPVTVIGGLGNDSVTGSDGADDLRGEAGSDTLRGGQGDDTLSGGDLNDKLYGDDGADMLHAGLGTNYLYGGNGGDDLRGDAGADHLYGETGKDVIRGAAGNDKLYGGDEADVLYDGAGNDQVRGEAGEDTLVAIGGGQRDSLYGGTGMDNIWGDSEVTEKYLDVEAAETAAKAIHKVATFHGGLSRDLNGQDFADPTILPVAGVDITYQDFSGNPLFRPEGPMIDDVAQGMVDDSAFLVGLMGVAQQDPTILQRAVVDLGDGTFAVRFQNGAASTFIRVDNDLPTLDDGTPAYAQLGTPDADPTDGPMWVAIFEKAWTQYRTSAGTYASIESDSMAEPFAALGLVPQTSSGWSTSSQLATELRSQFQAGKAVAFLTHGQQPVDSPFDADRAYLVTGIATDAMGNLTAIHVRNTRNDGTSSPHDPDPADFTLTIGDDDLTAIIAQLTACTI